jgi:hypothetical protein
MYRGIDVASSRYARLLGGNRTISEVSLRTGSMLCHGRAYVQHDAPTGSCPCEY